MLRIDCSWYHFANHLLLFFFPKFIDVKFLWLIARNGRKTFWQNEDRVSIRLCFGFSFSFCICFFFYISSSRTQKGKKEVVGSGSGRGRRDRIQIEGAGYMEGDQSELAMWVCITDETSQSCEIWRQAKEVWGRTCRLFFLSPLPKKPSSPGCRLCREYLHSSDWQLKANPFFFFSGCHGCKFEGRWERSRWRC